MARATLFIIKLQMHKSKVDPVYRLGMGNGYGYGHDLSMRATSKVKKVILFTG